MKKILIFKPEDGDGEDIDLVETFKGKPFIARKATLQDMKEVEWDADANYTDSDLDHMKSDYVVYEEYDCH